VVLSQHLIYSLLKPDMKILMVEKLWTKPRVRGAWCGAWRVQLPQGPQKGIRAAGHQRSWGAAPVSALRCPESAQGLKISSQDFGVAQNSPIPCPALAPLHSKGFTLGKGAGKSGAAAGEGLTEGSSRSLPPSWPPCAASIASLAPSVPVPEGLRTRTVCLDPGLCEQAAAQPYGRRACRATDY